MDENDSFLRFKAKADLSLPFSTLVGNGSPPVNKHVKRIQLDSAFVYSQDFNADSKWKAEDLDKALSFTIRLTYDIEEDFLPSWIKHWVDTLFVQFNNGRIAPIAENDTAFIVGIGLNPFKQIDKMVDR